jgi:hypothetical protein
MYVDSVLPLPALAVKGETFVLPQLSIETKALLLEVVFIV